MVYKGFNKKCIIRIKDDFDNNVIIEIEDDKIIYANDNGEIIGESSLDYNLVLAIKDFLSREKNKELILEKKEKQNTVACSNHIYLLKLLF